MQPKRNVSRYDLVGGAAGALLTFGLAKTAAGAEFEFKFGSQFIPGSPGAVRHVQMCEAIKRESNGRLNLTYYPASQLGGDEAILSQARLGATQMTAPNVGTIATLIPLMDLVNISFAIKDAEEGARVAEAVARYSRNDVAAKGLHIFNSAWTVGMLHVFSTARAIRTPNDLRNQKVRTLLGKTRLDAFKVLGANPQGLSANIVYSALQTKVLDGCEAAVTSLLAQRWYEPGGFYSQTGHGWTGVYIVVNGDVWKSLPADLQAILERNNTKYSALCQRDTLIGERAAFDKLARFGVPINTVDKAPFRTLLRGYFQSLASDFGAPAWKFLEDTLHRNIA